MAGAKEKLLVIGKSFRPRAFRGLKHDQLPVEWKHNKKAWMTQEIMIEWLRSFDKKMRLQKKKILLFLDNAASHPKDLELENIRVIYLPPNTTSICQPLDQGVIRNFKFHYRSLILKHLLTRMESSESTSALLKSVNVLDAIYFINNAWQQVTTTTVTNCFKSAGFGHNLPLRQDEFDPEDDVPLADLREISKLLLECRLEGEPEDFVLIDDDLDVEDDVGAIVDSVTDIAETETDSEVEDHEQLEETNINSYHEAHTSIENLKIFAAKKNDGEAVELLVNLQTRFQTKSFFSKTKQTKIETYFFK